jgi:hypothetical protein
MYMTQVMKEVPLSDPPSTGISESSPIVPESSSETLSTASKASVG